ncbi:hypothetical protein CBL_00834 [Carabus blaptoides fortunei]
MVYKPDCRPWIVSGVSCFQQSDQHHVFLHVLLSSSSVFAKRTTKRGIPDYGLSSFGGGFSSLPATPQDVSFSFSSLLTPQPLPIFVKSIPSITPTISFQKQFSYQAPVSPGEIASAVAAAKDASNQVQFAQQRVQAAKDALIQQQNLASAKESQATMAQQQSEAAAAIRRQQASAAASAVVHAQQKLAEAKSEVAEQQRMAAAKEAWAAAIIQKSASAAAAEIQRTDNAVAKIAAQQRSEAAAAMHHAAAAKDATLGAASAAVAAGSNGHSLPPPPPPSGPHSKYHPWS